MKVLIACEESQAVCIAFRNKGHEAYSCDIQNCSGDHPEWHIKGDVLEQLGQRWDLMIAFPPCTYLTVTANKWLKEQSKRKSGALVGKEREQAKKEAINFFMCLVNAPIEKIAIENPVGSMSTIYRKPNQIIQLYQFGDPFSKTTCLWLKNLHKLNHGNIVNKGEQIVYKSGKQIQKWYAESTAKERSKTFPGIAKAMANQWGSNKKRGLIF